MFRHTAFCDDRYKFWRSSFKSIQFIIISIAFVSVFIGKAKHRAITAPGAFTHGRREASPGVPQCSGKPGEDYGWILSSRAIFQSESESTDPTQGCRKPVFIHLTIHMSSQLKNWVDTLMKTLRDPSLPLLELQEIMTSVAGRIPVTVEKAIRKVMAQYASNITSVLCQFPSQRVSDKINVLLWNIDCAHIQTALHAV